MASKVKLSQLDKAINEALQAYEDKVNLEVKAVTNEVAKAGAKEIRQAARSTFNGNKYYKLWTSQVTSTRLSTDGVIYSKMPGLPHLLENGHLTRSGKRVAGRTHIAPVAEKISTEYLALITKGIQL